MQEREYTAMAATEETHWWYVGLHDLVLYLVRRETQLTPGTPRILDVGGGSGRLAQLMAPFGHVTLCDGHEPALQVARARGIPRVITCDLMQTNFGSSTYDVVTCIDVLYHEAISDERIVLGTIHHALRPGGSLIVHLPALECLRGAHDRAVQTRKRYRRPELRRLLNSAGFHVEWISYRLMLPVPGAWVWRWASRGRKFPNESEVSRSRFPALTPWLIKGIHIENRLICSGIRLPVGTSLIGLARKP